MRWRSLLATGRVVLWALLGPMARMEIPAVQARMALRKTIIRMMTPKVDLGVLGFVME